METTAAAAAVAAWVPVVALAIGWARFRFSKTARFRDVKPKGAMEAMEASVAMEVLEANRSVDLVPAETAVTLAVAVQTRMQQQLGLAAAAAAADFQPVFGVEEDQGMGLLGFCLEAMRAMVQQLVEQAEVEVRPWAALFSLAREPTRFVIVRLARIWRSQGRQVHHQMEMGRTTDWAEVVPLVRILATSLWTIACSTTMGLQGLQAGTSKISS